MAHSSHDKDRNLSSAHQAVRTRGRAPASAAGGGQILTTLVGLRIPAVLAFDAWQKAGSQIARVVSSSAWCLGDWLVYGQLRYADRYQDAVAAVGLDYQTLRNYAWVARSFELSRRRESVSFQHHAEVASLPVAEQEQLLDRAETLGWSRNQLRAAIRELRQGAETTQTPESKSAVLPRVVVLADRMEAWRRAAEQRGSDFGEWVMEALDRAAAEALVR